MISRKLLSILMLLSIALLLMSACESSTAPEEERGTISGTVNFTGTWPVAGDIQVSVYTGLTFPYIPMGPPEAFTDPISNSTSYDFEFKSLADGSYSAVYVSWRDPQNPAISKLLGMYWAQTDSVGIDTTTGGPLGAPAELVIDDNTPNHKNLLIAADLDLAQ